MHGSFSRAETMNFMAAIGPDFKRGFVDPAPVSNADIGRTIAQILGLTIKPHGRLLGRVIAEAMPGGTVPASRGQAPRLGARRRRARHRARLSGGRERRAISTPPDSPAAPGARVGRGRAQRASACTRRERRRSIALRAFLTTGLTDRRGPAGHSDRREANRGNPDGSRRCAQRAEAARGRRAATGPGRPPTAPERADEAIRRDRPRGDQRQADRARARPVATSRAG